MSKPAATTSVIVVRAALTALLFIGLGIAVERFFIGTALGQRLDASTFGAVIPVRSALGVWADRLRIALPGLAGLTGLSLFIAALVRRRTRDATAAGLVTIITFASSTVLKYGIPRPYLGEFGYRENTFPSGHTAVTVAVLIGAVWMLPGLVSRPAFLVASVVIGAAAGVFQVASYAHRLSDVVGGALLAGAVAACFLGKGRALRWRARLTGWLFVAITALGGVIGVTAWQSSGYATDTQVLATVGIILCSVASVCAAVMVGAERLNQFPRNDWPAFGARGGERAA